MSSWRRPFFTHQRDTRPERLGCPACRYAYSVIDDAGQVCCTNCDCKLDPLTWKIKSLAARANRRETSG